jgi:hypothetical protein
METYPAVQTQYSSFALFYSCLFCHCTVLPSTEQLPYHDLYCMYSYICTGYLPGRLILCTQIPRFSGRVNFLKLSHPCPHQSASMYEFTIYPDFLSKILLTLSTLVCLRPCASLQYTQTSSLILVFTSLHPCTSL